MLAGIQLGNVASCYRVCMGRSARRTLEVRDRDVSCDIAKLLVCAGRVGWHQERMLAWSGLQ